MKSRLLAVCCLLLSCLCQTVTAQDKDIFSYSFQDIDGQPVALESYKGKVVVLNFWATWCPPCIKEMPGMERLRQSMLGEPFEIIAINTGETEGAVSAFLLELDTELKFPILLDEQGLSFGALGLRGLPTTLIYDRSGKKVETVLGGREWDSADTLAKLQTLLKDK
ncbi:TlpA family protein disulfide reductase [Pontibacter sp. JAM-7]|uniref:TlpA family protein disulfide reductase n=1 Tax=Pontibacter sp. JAM-7 TaxID=3366581 RepID=UPI003AF418D5